ncbi:MAG: hypothetical protein K6U02_05885 [Firmicutes bacterium]|nr:hypothetical protein [Bacillota bacterium]
MRRTALLLASLLLVAVRFQAAPTRTATDRLVVIGGVDGDAAALITLLKQTGLVDGRLRWAGGAATLVQTGDVLGQGVPSRRVLDLLQTLEEQASRAGGRVVVLLGEQEIAHLLGELQGIAPEAYREFADADSERRRRRAWRDYVRLRRRLAEKYQLPPWQPDPAAEQQWWDAHPPGYLEYRTTLAPDGPYGRWLRQRDVVVRIGEVLFVHAGLSPQLRAQSLEQINQLVRQELDRFDHLRRLLVQGELVPPYAGLPEMVEAATAELARHRARIAQQQKEAEARGLGWELDEAVRQYLTALEVLVNHAHWFLRHPDGPLHFRGFAEWEEQAGIAQMTAVASVFDARWFVAGHAPDSDGRIYPRFGQRVFLLPHARRGRSAALEISAGRVTAIYPDERVVLAEPTATRLPVRIAVPR